MRPAPFLTQRALPSWRRGGGGRQTPTDPHSACCHRGGLPGVAGMAQHGTAQGPSSLPLGEEWRKGQPHLLRDKDEAGFRSWEWKSPERRVHGDSPSYLQRCRGLNKLAPDPLKIQKQPFMISGEFPCSFFAPSLLFNS